jgi:hypothetical protein
MWPKMPPNGGTPLKRKTGALARFLFALFLPYVCLPGAGYFVPRAAARRVLLASRKSLLFAGGAPRRAGLSL